MMDTLVRLVRGSDDCLFLSGRRSFCNGFRDDLGKHLLVMTTSVLGPNAQMGDVQEAIHVNRLLRVYLPGAEGGGRWELEADLRHVEILVSQMGLGDESKEVSTLGVRMNEENDGKECDVESRVLLPILDDAVQLLQPRCELQFAVKQLARRTQQPNAKNMQALMRLVRFLN